MSVAESRKSRASTPAALQRAAQRRQRARVEIGGHGDHRVDALAHAQRAQVRVHLERHVARARFVAPELAPVTSDTSSGRPRAAASAARAEARFARRGLDRQRLVREQLAIAGDGQRVVVEVDAVHGSV